MKDEHLNTIQDYNEGQIEAAHRVLIEVTNILREYEDEMCLIGGWVPELLFEGQGHTGSVDVDILFDHQHIEKDPGYLTVNRIMEKNGYYKHEEKYFSFIKEIIIDGTKYKVDVDFLAGKYGGNVDSKRSQHIQGLKMLKTTGGNFAFELPRIHKRLTARRPDGAIETSEICIVSIVPFLVMKAAALGRNKPKDAYDIYFCITKYEGGVRSLAKEITPYKEHGCVKEMMSRLREKFATLEHSGPVDVANFLSGVGHEFETDDELKQDVSGQVIALVERIEQGI
jgi:hypothetical protein